MLLHQKAGWESLIYEFIYIILIFVHHATNILMSLMSFIYVHLDGPNPQLSKKAIYLRFDMIWYELNRFDTVDGSEIPFPTTVWMYSSPVVNHGIFTKPYKTGEWSPDFWLPSTGLDVDFAWFFSLRCWDLWACPWLHRWRVGTVKLHWDVP